MSEGNQLPQLVIMEFGGQLTLKIMNRLRGKKYRSAILDRNQAVKWIKKFPVKGIILSGGLASVYDEDAPRVPQEVFALGVPVLGICYGMQAIADYFGGNVEKAVPQYARAIIEHRQCGPLRGTPLRQSVWTNHGDSVVMLPEGFVAMAQYTDTGGVAAIADERRKIYGVQFHPEADQTEYGQEILANFAEICGCERDWQPVSIADEIGEGIEALIGPINEIIGGGSGGVDSCTAGAIIARRPKLRQRIRYVTVDGGQFRRNEVPEARRNIVVAIGQEPIVVEAADRFFAVLTGVSDAQMKRRLFSQQYGMVFSETAQRLGPNVRWVMQGTLAPDRIESGKTGGAVIKEHHNEIADFGVLRKVNPLANLFKYEVRALARDLGLPESISERQPFPGPGEFIRHIGPITREGIDTVQWIDEQSTTILVHHGIYNTLSQLVPAYFAQPVVGIKGDKRSYQGFAALRAVQTADFMTAEGYAWPPDLQKELCRILGRHPKVVQVGFFPMDKPPGTTEFE